ncbi:MAG: metal-sensitive transcriptional regulator [Actinomycetota bacterium]|nr:metal-sensitive transcriptional regulator [Actinomycetota bacterium]
MATKTVATKKAAGPIAHVLSDQERLEEIIKRLSRAQGQLGGIIKMLETGRSCDEVITQIAAVGKAIDTAAFTLISTSLKECIQEDRSDADAVSAQLQRLFLILA